jgi:hypothetical protein
MHPLRDVISIGLSGLCVLGLVVLASACGGGGGDMAVFDVEPRRGDITGDIPVIIKGQNFRTDIGYTVYFGNQRATSLTIVDDQNLRVTTPAVEEPSAVDIYVLADNGPAFKVGNAFQYVLQEQAAGAGDKRGSLAY